MLLGVKPDVEVWCFKYGVMAFAMEGSYARALEVRNHFRRLFVRPLGESVRLPCHGGCNRILRFRPEYIWHSQRVDCSVDIPLGECGGIVPMVHFLKPKAVDILQQISFSNNRRLDLLDPNLPPINNISHGYVWAANAEKHKESNYRSSRDRTTRLGEIIRSKYEWYTVRLTRNASVPLVHRDMLRSDTALFPFLKCFKDWMVEEKTIA
eukprot:scaffold21615_cov181-Cylindrotheca_fusiformis.AAC.1